MTDRDEKTEIIPGRKHLLDPVPRRTRILLVEHGPEKNANASLLAKFGYQVEKVEDITAVAPTLKRDDFDVVIFSLPQVTWTQLEHIKSIRAQEDKVPCILLANASAATDVGFLARSISLFRWISLPAKAADVALAIRHSMALRRLAAIEDEAAARNRPAPSSLPFAPIVEFGTGQIWAYDVGLPMNRKGSFSQSDSSAIRDKLVDCFVDVPPTVRIVLPVANEDLGIETPLKESKLVEFADRTILAIQASPELLNVNELERTVKTLRLRGYTIAVSGFLHAVSSFHLLTRLNAGFARFNVQEQGRWQKEFTAIQTFCDEYKVQVIAESVDADKDERVARDAGFPYGQGSRISARQAHYGLPDSL